MSKSGSKVIWKTCKVMIAVCYMYISANRRAELGNCPKAFIGVRTVAADLREQLDNHYLSYQLKKHKNDDNLYDL